MLVPTKSLTSIFDGLAKDLVSTDSIKDQPGRLHIHEAYFDCNKDSSSKACLTGIANKLKPNSSQAMVCSMDSIHHRPFTS